MRGRTTSLIAILVVGVLGSPGRSAAGDDSETIAVEVHDFAAVPPAALAAATAVAGRVLRSAGIDVQWTPGHVPPASPLVLHILAPRHAAPVRSHSVLGYAVLPADGSHGELAGVRYGAVERQLHETTASLPVVLGYVIAHEIAHLLLGSNAHAEWGVMSAQLSGGYFDRAAQGTLLFAPDEAGRLRAGIRSRRAAAARTD